MSQTIENRFWKKVRKTADCWEWIAGCDSDGYGRIDKYRAHQLSYILAYGSIPKGKELNHTCQVRRCVRPDHLEALTHKEHLRKTPGTFGYKWAQRTHCEKNHELAGDNLVQALLKRGLRRCRTCYIEYQREYRRLHPGFAAAASRRWKEKQRLKFA